MRRYLAIAIAAVAPLLAASAAQAVVVDPSAAGTTITYPSDQSNYVGVALVPGTNRSSLPVPTVTTTTPCTDPWLASDLGTLPSTAMCWHGGAVMHRNETFALTWDPKRWYWATTRNYVEQFLRDVADGTNTFTSPFAVTGQYADGSADPASPTNPQNPTGPNPGGQARNASAYGGGCIDYGTVGGSNCQIGTGTTQGHDYPGSGAMGSCYVSGSAPCLTNSDIASEVSNIAQGTQLSQHKQPEYTPMVVVLTPPGVQVCLTSSRTLCSVNNNSSTNPKFCSYHSQVLLPDGTQVAYVVQPWSVGTACDEPSLPVNPNPSIDAGARLVNPLSQAQIGAIVNPFFNGWFAPQDGSEINDNNGCTRLGVPLDKVTVGSSPQNPYYMQGEFNNAGVIESDPNAPSCALGVQFTPTFVVPSAVNQGDVVQLDGSTTVSTLIVPSAGYKWAFGDGVTAAGPSVVHSYTTGGTYTVKLSVTDRGGNVASLSQTINVLGPNGLPVTAPSTQSPGGSTGSGTGTGGSTGTPGGSTTPPPTPALAVRLLLMPQSLRSALQSGIQARVSSNQPVDGFAQISISRSAARRAHIKAGRGPSVVIGRGTVAQIKNGSVSLRLYLSRGTAAKLKRIGHVTMTIRLSLVAASGDRLAIDAAGHY